jgi:hypothetical protein
MAELALVLAVPARSFRVECDDPHVPKPASVVVTRPECPVRFRFFPRAR